MKLLLTLGVVAFALATAAPALAGNGQSTTQSIGIVQVGSASVSPAVSASAPLNINASVCVASDCSSGAATQASDGSAAATTTNETGQSTQGTDQSVGTVQVGSANVSPSVGANAPVNGNVPVCVASDCSGSHGAQHGGSSASSVHSSGQNHAGDQSTQQSIGTVQVGSANVSPSVGANAPVNGNVPACFLSDCSGATAGQSSGGAAATTTGSGGGGSGGGGGGGGGGRQTTDQSVGTVQVGSVGVSPSSATNTPVNANTPVCVGSDCSSTNSQQGSSGSGTAETGPPPNTTNGAAPATSSATPSSATPSAATPGRQPSTATGGSAPAAATRSKGARMTRRTATASVAHASKTVNGPKATLAGRQLPYTGLSLLYALVIALALFGGGVVTARWSNRLKGGFA